MLRKVDGEKLYLFLITTCVNSCFFFQAYTQSGGKRPFGVSILYIGWDKHYGYQLYQSDPSGNYGGWKVRYLILRLWIPFYLILSVSIYLSIDLYRE